MHAAPSFELEGSDVEYYYRQYAEIVGTILSVCQDYSLI